MISPERRAALDALRKDALREIEARNNADSDTTSPDAPKQDTEKPRTPTFVSRIWEWLTEDRRWFRILLIVFAVFLFFHLERTLERSNDDARRAIYEEGYREGYDDGYDEGEANGLELGHENGYADGYDDGYDDGYGYGYDDGYNDALDGY